MIILGSVYVFFVFSLLQANGHNQKSSLTFVIDDTGSMEDDIVQVISKTNEVFDAVLRTNSSKIDDFVLVTFNDPGTKLRTITRDRDEFKRALYDIEIIPGSGGDCPEYAMSGIELALQKSKPNSFFYVFTDAAAKDHRKLELIKSLSHKKSTQVSFLLTGVCGSTADNDYVVYDKLAEATSGQVFHIRKHDINKIINYIIASITEKKTTLSQNVFNSGYGNKISFTVDSKVWDVIVSISGAYPNFDVTDADGKLVETDVVASTDNTAIRKIKTKPGVYTVTLRGPRRTSVVVTGSTSICFEHGFSVIEPQSLNHTSTLPLPGYKSYLSIALTNKDRDVTLKTVEIRDLNNNVIEELPVTLINGDSQFYTTSPFDPPTEPFRIAINGFTNTGEKVTRVSSTPIQPQKPEMGRNISPVVNILSDPIIVINHGDPITLKCKIRGYPQPVVTWTDTTGAIYPSKVVPVDLPYDYISELTINKITKNSTITCKASNSEENDDKSVIVGIKTYFHITEQPKDIVVEYGTSTEAKLVIDAFPPATITWYKDDKQITGSDSFNLSPDSSILSIRNMQLKLKGNYSVKVGNGNEEKIISFKVNISGIEKPKIDKNVTVYTKKVGFDVDLQCRLLQGKPKPTLYWYILDEYEEKKKIDENGATVHIDNLKKDDAATYICEAINEIGKDYHTISLDVEFLDPPSIVLNTKNNIVMENEQVILICNADGFPLPQVRWYKNSSEISSDSKYRSPYDNILRFRASIEDTGRYTCEASNHLGTVQENVNLNVYDPIKVKSPEKVLNVLVGSHLELPCVADGYPVPEIKWTFSSFDDVPPETEFTFRELGSETVPTKLRPNENNSIVIPRIQLQDEGYYICVANNSVESVTVGYEVHVLAVPVIKKSLSDKTLEAVEGDLVLRIPCQADGRPKATILWTLDDRNIALGTEWYDVDEHGTLLIKNVEKTSSGTYKCTAKNSLGSDWKETYVDVQPYPRSSKVTRKELYEEGTKANIKCDLPHVKTDLLRWFKNGRLIKIGELSIRNIAKTNSGLYSCRVSNILSSHSSHKIIVVGRKPQFDKAEETDIEYSDDATVYLDCSASGYPKPTVTWTHNGDIIEEKSYFFGLQMKPTDIGNFTCVLSNDFGSISRTYNIIAEDCLIDIENHFTTYRPLILTPSIHWPVSETVGGSLRVSKNKLLYFYCHEGFILHDKSNFGMVAPAMCSGKQTFFMNKVYVDYNNLKCNKEIKPLAKATGKKCTAGNTEQLLVGFSVGHQFLDVYEVCFDKDENVTIYAKNKINNFLANFVPKRPFKFVGSKYLPNNFNDIYECRDKCCFEKRQLVNAKDVSPGYPQLSTYNDLNVSPHWSTCGTENWDEVEKRVRSLAKSIDYSLLVWTGTNSDAGRIPSVITYQSIVEDRPAPRFTWKVVVNLQERQALAIIQVNVPNLKPHAAASYVLCTDICEKVEWMNNPEWRNVKQGYTYCCRLQDFVKAFGYDYVFRDYVRFTKVLRSQNLLPRHSLTK